LALVAPTNQNRTEPSRAVNAAHRKREHLTPAEIEKLIDAAKHNRHDHRDSTLILVAFRHGFHAQTTDNASRARARARKPLGNFCSDARGRTVSRAVPTRPWIDHWLPGANGNRSIRLTPDGHSLARTRTRARTLKRKVMEVKQRYGSSTLLIEDSPISRGLIQSLREKSINVTPYKPDTDKRARVIAQTDLFAGGSVRFPRRAAWLEDFTAELLAFPGRHDDQVDALTQGLAWGRVSRGDFCVKPIGGTF